MSNKPIKTLSISPKRADGSYIKLGNNATWGDDKWRWSINVTSLRELLTLLDSGVIEAKNGYIGGNCGVFSNEDVPSVNNPHVKPDSMTNDVLDNNTILF